MTTAPVPYRYREHAFRRFEDDIATALRAGGYHVNPADRSLSQCRCAQGIRDAIKSYEEYGWTSTIPYDDFVKWKRNIVVSERANGLVYIGNPKAAFDLEAAPKAQHVALDPLTLRGIHEARLLCKLAHLSLFKQPIPIVGITAQDVVALEKEHDVIIEKEEDHWLIV